MKNKVWIVTFYNAESEKDWSIVVASTYDLAIKTARQFTRDAYGLEKGERLDCTDFEAFTIDDECDLKGNVYKVILEEVK